MIKVCDEETISFEEKNGTCNRARDESVGAGKLRRRRERRFVFPTGFAFLASLIVDQKYIVAASYSE